MLKIKFKLFIAKNSNWILTILISILLFLIVLFCHKIDITKFKEPLSSDITATIGTLFGAIIGGVFTLIGTKFQYKQQLKAQTQIKRKNLIYKPLYDELIEIQNILLNYYKFPLHVVIDKQKRSYPNSAIQFTVWERIKNDSRFLDVPKCLKLKMDKLYSSIEIYDNSKTNVIQILSNLLNETLEKELSTKCTIVNIGECIFNHILSTNNYNVFQQLDGALSPQIEITEEEKVLVSKIIYEKCLKNEEINHIITSQQALVDHLKDTIELLISLISFVTVKYEE